MKILFAAALVSAVSVMSGAAVAQDRMNWSGPYVGAHVGYAEGETTTTREVKDWCAPGDAACFTKYVGPFSYDLDGAFGGATLGYNHQIGVMVFGVEADLGYLDASGHTTSASSNPLAHNNLDTDGGLYALVGGRVGVTLGQALVYAKGGLAYWDTDITMATTNPGFTTNGSGSLDGYGIGGGIEYALANGWSIKGEYLRLSFEDSDGVQIRNSDGYTFDNHSKVDDVDTIKFGLNRRF